MFLLFFLLWMIIFGSFTLESVLFGLGIAALIFIFACAFLDYSPKKEMSLYRKIPLIVHFLIVLVREVIKANLTVIHMIFSGREELEPVIVHFHPDLKTPAGRAAFADSITLTPGTITVFLRDDEFVVHCLDESLAPGIDTSECEKDISEIETE